MILPLKIIAMKKSKLSRTLTLAGMVTTACLCIGWADTWNDIKNSAGNVTSVRADFYQEKHMKILSRPLVSKGVFYFQSPNSLRWEYRFPVQNILLMHEGKTKRYTRKNGTITEDAGVRLSSMQVLLHEITRWLSGRFDENPSFSTSLEPGRKIVLSPKEKSLAKMIQRIELTLSNRPGIIQSVSIYEGKDSFTRFEFKNVTINQPLEDSLFRKMR